MVESCPAEAASGVLLADIAATSPVSDPQEGPDNTSTYFRNGRPEMLPFIPLTARRILEAGCSQGRFGEQLKARGATEVWGIEPNAQAAEQARRRLDRVLEGTIERAIENLPEKYFDCIVFNDVLEHLVDPWQVLSAIRAKMGPGGTLVASIPNVRYFPVLKALALHSEWRYASEGVLDRTHLRFFTWQTMRDMFVEAGYHVVEIKGINGSHFSRKFRVLNSLLLGALDDTKYLQYACVAHPK
jgi:2-polyprenyl-3-methyl-5-hydroxy-6-metoxy-1,4-benzoquinol methylase